jgi:hypothetical protein
METNQEQGFALCCVGCLLGWISKRQSLTAQSLKEDEVIVANRSIRSLLWLRNIFIEP